MALSFDLAAIPLKYVAFPVVVGLAAGTGALAAYVTNSAAPAAKEPAVVVAALPATTPAPAPTPTVAIEQPEVKSKKLSCHEQTWPYIDNRCIAGRTDQSVRSVRIVMAPRDGEGGSASGTNGKAPKLVTSDGVLRGPGVAPEMDSQKVKAAPAAKKSVKRSEAPRRGRDDFRRVYSVYSVPSADSTKPIIVVRPTGVEQYSSRF